MTGSGVRAWHGPAFGRGGRADRAALGLADVRIGDTLGTPRAPTNGHYFAPPTLESVVVPHRPADRGAPRGAGAARRAGPADRPPQDDLRHEIAVSLYGEVQKEVIEATLATEYGIEADFRETTTICVERPIVTGAAVEYLGQAGNPFRATVGLRVEPPANTGVAFRLERPAGHDPLRLQVGRRAPGR